MLWWWIKMQRDEYAPGRIAQPTHVLALVLAMPHTSPCKEERQVDDQQQSRSRPTIRRLLWAVATVGPLDILTTIARLMDDQQRSRSRSIIRRLLWAVATVGLLVILTIAILIGYHYKITLWDWIKLLIVPAVIAGGGLWFNAQQREREQRTAHERAQDEALQGYLDGMSELLTDKERPLHRAQPGDSLSTVARARTLTALGRLDGGRKRSVLRFLFESELIYKERTFLDESGLMERRHNIVSLQQADLTKADLRGASLRGADLRGAKLSGADLRGADLSGADLFEATLFEADLRGADLSGADLRGSNLRVAYLSGVYQSEAGSRWRWLRLSGADLSRTDLFGADLSRVFLRGANLSGAELSGAKLSRANLAKADLGEAKLIRADLSGADLRGADLFEATLFEADLRGADLRGAKLSGLDPVVAYVSGVYQSQQVLRVADLTGANLSEANLKEAIVWTEEQLRAASSLEGATMPDGRKYEDWLKSRTTGRMGGTARAGSCRTKTGSRARAAGTMGRTAALRNGS
jgi:uncharacterized protein YjbI with pentapeptide repeats